MGFEMNFERWAENLYNLREKSHFFSRKAALAELRGCNKSPIQLQKYHSNEKL